MFYSIGIYILVLSDSICKNLNSYDLKPKNSTYHAPTGLTGTDAVNWHHLLPYCIGELSPKLRVRPIHACNDQQDHGVRIHGSVLVKG